PTVAVTVRTPTVVARQLLAVHVAAGGMVNVAVEVLSPSDWPYASKPSTLNTCATPVPTIATAGETATRVIGPKKTIGCDPRFCGTPSTLRLAAPPAGTVIDAAPLGVVTLTWPLATE